MSRHLAQLRAQYRLLLTVPDAWFSVPYVMAAGALSGIAKDLDKMTAKASVKTLAGVARMDRLSPHAVRAGRSAVAGPVDHRRVAAKRCRQDEVQADQQAA